MNIVSRESWLQKHCCVVSDACKVALVARRTHVNRKFAFSFRLSVGMGSSHYDSLGLSPCSTVTNEALVKLAPQSSDRAACCMH